MKTPPRLNDNQKRALKLKAIRYTIIKGQLWWRDTEGVLLKCIDEEKSIRILNEMYSGVSRGHYMPKKMTHKVIGASFGGPFYLKMQMNL